MRVQFRYTGSIQGVERIVQVYWEYTGGREDSLGILGVYRGYRGKFIYTGSIQGLKRIVQVYWEYPGGRADILDMLGVSRGVERIVQVYWEYLGSREDSLGILGVSREQRGQFRYARSIQGVERMVQINCENPRGRVDQIQGVERIVQVYWEYTGGTEESLFILGVSRG